MSFLMIARSALHLLLALSLVLPVSLWPAQTIMTQADAVTDVAGMPCHDALPMAAKTDSGQPCEEGCCPQSTCDLSACLATALLPQFARLHGAMPSVPLAFPWHTSAPPPRSIDTPLRPPIA